MKAVEKVLFNHKPACPASGSGQVQSLKSETKNSFR